MDAQNSNNQSNRRVLARKDISTDGGLSIKGVDPKRLAVKN